VRGYWHARWYPFINKGTYRVKRFYQNVMPNNRWYCGITWWSGGQWAQIILKKFISNPGRIDHNITRYHWRPKNPTYRQYCYFWWYFDAWNWISDEIVLGSCLPACRILDFKLNAGMDYFRDSDYLTMNILPVFYFLQIFCNLLHGKDELVKIQSELQVWNHQQFHF